MKLINTKTNQEFKHFTGMTLLGQTGKMKGVSFILGEIIPPSVKEPRGLLKSKKTGISWQSFYPSVFGLKIVEG